jgi:hypothetical protein
VHPSVKAKAKEAMAKAKEAKEARALEPIPTEKEERAWPSASYVLLAILWATLHPSAVIGMAPSLVTSMLLCLRSVFGNLQIPVIDGEVLQV